MIKPVKILWQNFLILIGLLSFTAAVVYWAGSLLSGQLVEEDKKLAGARHRRNSQTESVQPSKISSPATDNSNNSKPTTFGPDKDVSSLISETASPIPPPSASQASSSDLSASSQPVEMVRPAQLPASEGSSSAVASEASNPVSETAEDSTHSSQSREKPEESTSNLGSASNASQAGNQARADDLTSPGESSQETDSNKCNLSNKTMVAPIVACGINNGIRGCVRTTLKLEFIGSKIFLYSGPTGSGQIIFELGRTVDLTTDPQQDSMWHTALPIGISPTASATAILSGDRLNLKVQFSITDDRTGRRLNEGYRSSTFRVCSGSCEVLNYDFYFENGRPTERRDLKLSEQSCQIN